MLLRASLSMTSVPDPLCAVPLAIAVPVRKMTKPEPGRVFGSPESVYSNRSGPDFFATTSL